MQQRQVALGWGYTGAIGAGRVKEYAPDGEGDTGLFWRQVKACGYEVWPGKVLVWGADDPRLHDDLLVSAALVAALDEADWRLRVAIARGTAAPALRDTRAPAA